MSDTAPLRRPGASGATRSRAARNPQRHNPQPRTSDVRNRQPRSMTMGDFFGAISSYGVTRMTDNIHAGDMRKRISAMFMAIFLVLSLVYLRVRFCGSNRLSDMVSIGVPLNRSLLVAAPTNGVAMAGSIEGTTCRTPWKAACSR